MRNFEQYKRMMRLCSSLVIIMIEIAIYSFVWVNYYDELVGFPFFRRGNWLIVALYGVLLLFFLKMYGGLKIGYWKKSNIIYSQILSVLMVNAITYLQNALLAKRFHPPTHILLMTLVDMIMIVMWATAFQILFNKMFPPKRMLLISGDKSDYHLLEKMNSRADKYVISAVLSLRDGIDLILRTVERYDGVIIGDIPSHQRNLIIKHCFAHSVRSYSIPKISDILIRSSEDLTLFDSPLLLSRNIGLQIEQQFAKRALDLLASVIGLILSLPIFLIVAVAIKLTDHGPVFYTQKRLTKDGQIFNIYKFRTMIQDAEKDGVRLAESKDDRVLPIGRILRATRLDELPQLYNVLKGEMSMVGPRPERPEIADMYLEEIPEFTYRLKVKAGLTGYAQIYGKYNTTPYDKLKLDLMYIRNYSIFLDMKLIIMTPKIMFMKESTEGIAEGQITATLESGFLEEAELAKLQAEVSHEEK